MLNELLRLRQKNPKKVIGLMSGTSADGIDACLAEVFGNGINTKINIIACDTYPYDRKTRTAILETCSPETGTVDKVCQLNFYLGKLFADAAKSIANKAHIPLTEIDLIGSHGQTIYHLPNPALRQDSDGLFAHPPQSSWVSSSGEGKEMKNSYREKGMENKETFSQKQSLKDRDRSFHIQCLRSTLQIGEPSVIVHETGITTVADFRPADMAAGGQGAPLIPYADFILFRDKEKGRTLQNIGGIANVTFLPSDCSIHDVIAFDTGPGNMIIDRITEIITHNVHHFDENGNLAAQGEMDNHLLASLLTHPYLSKIPPKTTGREEFGRSFADNLYKEALSSGVKDIDILTTVTAFTAQTIADSYKKWILPRYHLSEVILSGGGSRNSTVIKFLSHYLPSSVKIHTIDTYGIASNAKEALTFAILANETISGNPNNVMSATGAGEAVIMGKIIPGRRFEATQQRKPES